LATFKHISSKNADYGAAEQYLTFEHDEFTMKPTLDGNGRLVLRDDYRISSLNCGEEDFAIACMRSNLKYGKNQKREDVKSHHYIISFDPRDAPDNGLTVDRAQALGEEFCKTHFPSPEARQRPARSVRFLWRCCLYPAFPLSPKRDRQYTSCPRCPASRSSVRGWNGQEAAHRAALQYVTSPFSAENRDRAENGAIWCRL